LWRWFVGTVVEARKRMLRKLSRSHGACPVECHKTVKGSARSSRCFEGNGGRRK